MTRATEPRRYAVPCYRAADGVSWFHFLHGNVPGHEIDFIHRPEVPQGALTRQHHSHVSRLVKYIEPPASGGFAFCIGNLSRDDTQHEPGHGAVALIFGLRVRGATDHANRPEPPFSHAIAAIDRALDGPSIFAAATAFHRRALGEGASADWYRSYARAAIDEPSAIGPMLTRYIAGFDDLPRVAPSSMSQAWMAGDSPRTGRVVVVYPDGAPFEVLARVASRIAAVLYRSDVKWSAISNGSEEDLPGGITVRFVTASASSSAGSDAALWSITDIPDDDEAIARELFGVSPVESDRFQTALERHAVASDPPPSVDITVDQEEPSADDDDPTVRLNRGLLEGENPIEPMKQSEPAEVDPPRVAIAPSPLAPRDSVTGPMDLPPELRPHIRWRSAAVIASGALVLLGTVRLLVDDGSMPVTTKPPEPLTPSRDSPALPAPLAPAATNTAPAPPELGPSKKSTPAIRQQSRPRIPTVRRVVPRPPARPGTLEPGEGPPTVSAAPRTPPRDLPAPELPNGAPKPPTDGPEQKRSVIDAPPDF